MNNIKRIYSEKKPEYNIEATVLFRDLKENLGINGLRGVRILNRYDISQVGREEFNKARKTIFSEPPLDFIFEEKLSLVDDENIFALEYLPGQYDQRADSASQCIQIITLLDKPLISAAKVYILKGNLADNELKKIKRYLINPVDSREASLEKPASLETDYVQPAAVKKIDGFISQSLQELQDLKNSLDLAMTLEDLLFCQQYFAGEENRDPFITEIKMLDTYWSDHCRHTTFNTLIKEVIIEESDYTKPVNKTFKKYKMAEKEILKTDNRDLTLMNIAVMSMKEMRKRGYLDDMEISGEVNACSIVRDVKINGKDEKWLIMFKNETHNHPTEIEPFGGAATCLGGAIRDPLSGRAYVYQAMRVSGSGDPGEKIENTIEGKLPQRKITTEAALGYSSYGNQIGLATGLVNEIYHQGYLAKRMEVGAVVGAVRQKDVKREEALPGDIIMLVGGKTGRDGIGGATGSSKVHNEESINTAGAEVQKGNPVEERKLQRLFRDPHVTRLIKKSNDFGAGGVSVAIGELADGLIINLDKVPKKYKGLDGTELALSESQERMAVVLDKKDEALFTGYAERENLLAVKIAEVTSDNRLRMFWQGEKIVDINREFINTHGVKQTAAVYVKAPLVKNNFFKRKADKIENLEKSWVKNLGDLNICCQKGLGERFDSSIGTGSVFMPYGGKYQLTPTETMVAKIPALEGETDNATVMGYGFNPYLSEWSPYHGAVYAVIEVVAKIVAAGGDYKKVRLSLQEYFEKLGKNREKWGKPFAALLGAYSAMTEFSIAAIGGKDSMSGTFEDIHVPPTLIAFGLDLIEAKKAVSPEFKRVGSKVVLIKALRIESEVPDYSQLKINYDLIQKLTGKGKVLAAHTVTKGGIAEALSKMCFGNRTGFKFAADFDLGSIFNPDYGSIVIELDRDLDYKKELAGSTSVLLGETIKDYNISGQNLQINMEEAEQVWREVLRGVFPDKVKAENTPADLLPSPLYHERKFARTKSFSARPRVLITTFPGSNCEYDTARAFARYGAVTDITLFRNLHTSAIEESIAEFKRKIDNSQIIVIPGGFSLGDEPEGSGKFITAVFNNPVIRESITDFLHNRDGLMLGICNGFQALIKLGLVPFGEIREMDPFSPTLTFNTLGRHVSFMVNTKIVSVLSPWFMYSEPGDILTIPVSHGEGRFVGTEEMIGKLFRSGQIATQYVNLKGDPTMDMPYNPNGSMYAIEGITSPDGRILGKMGHAERLGENIAKNITGNKEMNMFKSGIDYFS